MSDLEEFIALFDRLGVEYQEYEGDLLCEEGYGKIEGHPLTYTRFHFDKRGKFIKMGAYE